MPASPPEFRFRDGWWGRLILQIRRQEYDIDIGLYMWQRWCDAKVTDVSKEARVIRRIIHEERT